MNISKLFSKWVVEVLYMAPTDGRASFVPTVFTAPALAGPQSQRLPEPVFMGLPGKLELVGVGYLQHADQHSQTQDTPPSPHRPELVVELLPPHRCS